MIKILSLFEKIGFLAEQDGSYMGAAVNTKYGKVRFEFKNHFLTCTTNNETKNPQVLFSVIYGELKIGTLIFLLQEFKIIDFNFIAKHITDVEEEVNNQL